jgi:hypothetical protein
MATAIDALPVERLGTDRSRRLAEAFADWNDFIGTVRAACEEFAAFSARDGREQAISHMGFLRAGGGDLLTDDDPWPRPNEIGALWRLLAIDGVGLKSVAALLDAFSGDACQRVVSEIERRYRIV